MTDWLPADWPVPERVVAGTTLRGKRFNDLGFPGNPCEITQVHGCCVVRAGPFDVPPEADASISSADGDVCLVRTADCLPVLFCSSDGGEIAAAHAGWRGLAAGILENTVAAMSCEPGSIKAWLGPGISQPAFEVGDEVRAVFVDADIDAKTCFEQNGNGRWQADLYGLARRRLRAVGVQAIFGGGLCTHADADRFFSYRRDPHCGRMETFITVVSP